jgi:hypothetical protein
MPALCHKRLWRSSKLVINKLWGGVAQGAQPATSARLAACVSLSAPKCACTRSQSSRQPHADKNSENLTTINWLGTARVILTAVNFLPTIWDRGIYLGAPRRSPAPGSRRTWRADFPHQRSWTVASQHCKRLQLPIGEAQLTTKNASNKLCPGELRVR